MPMIDECRNCGSPESDHPKECVYFDAALEGEGVVQLKAQRQRRVDCESCGNGAWFRNTFLLRNSRSNPRSAGYGKDDISWCADEDQFKCKECQPKNCSPSFPDDDYRWCSTFDVARFPHMFLKTVDVQLRVSDVEAWLAKQAVSAVSAE